MKIVHVIFSFNTGGAETMLVDLLNQQGEESHVELIVINNSYNKELLQKINKRIIIHILNRSPGSLNPFKILQFNYRIQKINPDVVHFHDHDAVGFVILKLKAKKCLTVHTINVPIHNFSKFHQLFSISNSVRRDVFRRSNMESITVYNGVRFKTIAQRVNYNYSQFKIVQVSRLDHAIKGQHILLKAMQYLVHHLGFTNLHLDFIGEGSSDCYLKELTRDYFLSPYVSFLGMKDRSYIYANLKTYNLLVQPSIYEGFGLTIVEGIAAGIPVITSNIDGPAEIVDNLPGCRTFESENSTALALAISDIINSYKMNQILNFCKASYLMAIEKFSIELTSSNYLNNYKMLIK